MISIKNLKNNLTPNVISIKNLKKNLSPNVISIKNLKKNLSPNVISISHKKTPKSKCDQHITNRQNKGMINNTVKCWELTWSTEMEYTFISKLHWSITSSLTIRCAFAQDLYTKHILFITYSWDTDCECKLAGHRHLAQSATATKPPQPLYGLSSKQSKGFGAVCSYANLAIMDSLILVYTSYNEWLWMQAKTAVTEESSSAFRIGYSLALLLVSRSLYCPLHWVQHSFTTSQ